MRVCVCSFSSTDDLKGKRLTYANVKACVLQAGRFSVFEATASHKHAIIFTDLHRDPELIVETAAYPWTRVRRNEAQSMTPE